MNTHNQWILQTWRANCDRQLLLDHQATIRYTTKYVGKAEKTSKQLLRALQKMVRYSDETDTVTKTVNKVMNKCIGIRDMSKNEVCSFIAGDNHYDSSRTVKAVNLFENENGYVNFSDPHRNVYGKTFVEKYMDRDQKYENMNIDTYALKVDFVKGKEKDVSKTTIKNRVCRFRPRYSANPQSESYPEYCTYNLLRFKSFRAREEIFTEETSDQELVENWIKFLQDNPGIPLPKYREQLENAEYVLQCIELGEDIETPPHEMDPNYNWFKKNVKTILNEDKIPVCRDMQKWKKLNLQYSDECMTGMETILRDYQSENRDLTDCTCDNTNRQNVTYQDLKGKQKEAYNLVRNHFRSTSKNQLLAMILGGAGSGKSFLIHSLAHLLGDKCTLTATTGIAAWNVNGRTIHSVLSLTKNNISTETLTSLQDALCTIEYIIVDECSMMGQRLLFTFDQRLREICANNLPFGGKNIIFVGHFAQLPPVLDTHMWMIPPIDASAVKRQGYSLSQ